MKSTATFLFASGVPTPLSVFSGTSYVCNFARTRISHPPPRPHPSVPLEQQRKISAMHALLRAARAAARSSFAAQAQRRGFASQHVCPHDPSKSYHKSPLPLEAAGGLLEYSVVYTDRAMNHMSKPFCKVTPFAHSERVKLSALNTSTLHASCPHPALMRVFVKNGKGS
jgi:hypothetical protein